MSRWYLRALVLVVIAAVLVGCSSSSSSSAANPLTGKTWQWTASTTATPASQSVVPDPTKFTITFATDGSFNSKVACNVVNGTYTTGANNALTIKPGPSTLAACGTDDDALSTLFIAGLSAASTYAISGSTLTITDANSDTLTFTAK